MPPSLHQLHGLLTLAVGSIAVDTDHMSIGFRDDPCPCFCIRVASTDLGKVIGRQGSTIRALRTIVQAAGQQAGADVRICVGEVDGLRDVATLS